MDQRTRLEVRRTGKKPVLKDRVRPRFPRRMRGSIRRIRDRPRRPLRPLPLLKLIAPADLVTLMNFICGVLAVMISINGGDGLRVAMMLIILGIIFDGLDGPVARRFGSSHNFGIWLDSIADAMTFCVAPAILVYIMFRDVGNGSFYNAIVIVASLSITILGILRLARFSIFQNKWKDFIGLPAPAFAMLVVSLTSLYHWSLSLEVEAEFFTTGETILIPCILFFFSFAMVSDILYRKYRGKILLFAAFILMTMEMSLLFGVNEPVLGMMGSMLFTAASLGYFFSPALQGPRNIWGAKRRLELDLEEDLSDDLDDDDLEDLYDDY